MKGITTKLASPTRLGMQSFRNAWQRLSMALLVMLLTATTAWAQEAIGAIQYNSSTGYYEINTTNKLKDLAVYVNGSGDYSTGGSETTNHKCQNLKFRLTDDLDFGGGSEYTSNFTPIGARSKWFQGEFDGNGKTISGVRVYRSGKDETNDCYIGIFGQTYDGANIHDLTVNDAVFTGFHYVGGIAGHFYGGSLTRCTVTSSVYVKGCNTYSYTHGGITGDNNGTLTNCVSSATLSNGGCQNCLYYGGIAGRSTHTITGCLAVGVDVPNVFGSDQYDDTYGAICGGYSGDNYSFSGNYYRDCKLNGTATASGFGLKAGDVSGQAEPGIIVSGIPSNVTVSPVALSYGGHDYYGANSVLTFGTGADNKVFSTFTATGATASSLSADKKTATVTLGSSDVTLAISATFQTISGTTEDGLTWNLAQDADGNYTELTIGGTGPMQNYQYTTGNVWKTKAPWGTDITSVTVGDGVTSIGNYAFIGCENVASVTIGSGVTSIGIGAINHCDQMTTVTLPASVTTIAYAAFENCQKLETIYINHDGEVSLTGNHDNAFNAPLLQTINFPSLAGAAANYATTGNWSGYSDKLRPLSRLTIGEGVAVTSDVITEGGATYVHPGQTVTFSVSSGFVVPEGYTFSGTYIPEGGKATAATDQGSGSWSFTVPAANVTVIGVRSDGLSHSVTYMQADGTTDTHDAIALDETMTTLAAGWYFIGKDINYSQTVRLNGSTTIILKNGCTMSIGEDSDGKRINGKGIYGNLSYPLTIYGQSLDDTTTGHLKVFTTGNSHEGIYYSPYTQHSGNVTVKAKGDDAIISYGDVTVNGGTLSATSLTDNAVYIGNHGDIIINGGKVNATSSAYSALRSYSGDVTINGGQVEATGNSYSIRAQYGTITLGWTNATDYIHASGYDSTVKTAAGKRLAYTDDDNVLHVLGGDSETTLTADEIAAIAGKTLRPMLTGSGTTDDLYLISNATDWDVFCDLLEENNQGIFTGKTVVLDKDIAVTRMAGSTNHEFSGTFDGQTHTLTVAITGTVQGTAPFCEIKGATIRNLAVTGSVAGKRHSAGLVGFARGDNSITNTIENCLVNTSVSITGDTNGYLGGIVGHGLTSALTIRGCAFTGSLTSTSNYTGGLQGWSDGNTLVLENDLFAASSVNAANVGFHPIAIHANNKTTTATVSNVYYTVAPTCTQASRIATANAAEQPKQQRNITAGENVTVSNVALTGDETTYNVSGITAYSGGGLKRTVNDETTLYYGSDDQISLTLSNTATGAPLGYQYDGYTANAGTLSGSANPYTLTMPDENVTVSVDTEALAPIDWATQSTGEDADHAYMIYNKDQLLLLAYRVNGTHGETRQEDGYYGKYFKLGADIDFTSADMAFDGGHSNYEAIGGYYNNTDCYFCCHFDGNNKTVKGIRINKNGDGYDAYADNNQGLFGKTRSGAYIHDVRLTDARITGFNNVGGIVGITGYGTVSNCTVTESDITATLNDGYGIIFGFSSQGTLTNNYYHGCTVNGNAVTSGAGCNGADITANNGAVPAYHLALGENITTPPGTFVGQTEWLDTPPVDARLAPENGFTLAGNHYFVSGYEFTPGSTLASGAAQGYTLRVTLGGQLLDPYTPTGDADPLDGKAIALLTITADCDGKTLAAALRSDGQPHDITYIKADGTTGEASAIALDGTEYDLGQNNQETWYFVGLPTVAFDHTLDLYGDVNLILADGCTCTMNVTGSYNDGIDVFGTLTIYGQTDGTGTLNATDLYLGIFTDSGTITISGGRVTATSDNGAGIYISSGNLTISGGRVTATSKNGYGIFTDSGTITISGGRVTATGNEGIHSNGTITLGCTTASDFIYASSYGVGLDDRLNIVDGQTLYDEDGKSYSGTLSGTLSFENIPNGKTLRPLRNVLALYDSEDNSEAISGSNGQQCNVILYDRTLYKDGAWNTLCLPFDVVLANSPLAGATAKTVIGTTTSGNDLTINFGNPDSATEPVTVLKAGVPYIIKWDATNTNIVEPVFTGVTVVSSTEADRTVSVLDGDVKFVGYYDALSLDPAGSDDFAANVVPSIYYMTADNTLKHTGVARTLHTCRAYFQFANEAAAARQFILDFGDDATGVAVIDNGKLIMDNEAGAVYDLQGRKVNGRWSMVNGQWSMVNGQLKKGLYIVNGKKIVVK